MHRRDLNEDDEYFDEENNNGLITTQNINDGQMVGGSVMMAEEEGIYISNSQSSLLQSESAAEMGREDLQPNDDDNLAAANEDGNGGTNNHPEPFVQKLKNIARKILDMVIVFVPLGILSFGGPIAHIALLEKQFVKKKKWIDEQHFTELFSLSQSLPGPTSTQMVIAVGTIFMNSIFGGILAFVLFSLPTAIIMTVAGLFMSDQNITAQFPPLVFVMLNGFSCAAVALVVQAAWQLSKKLSESMFGKSLLLFACMIFMVVQQPWMLVLLMAIGGILTIAKYYLEKFIENRLKNYISESEEEKISSLELTLNQQKQNEGFIGFSSYITKFKIYVEKLKVFTRSFKRSPRENSNPSTQTVDQTNKPQKALTTFKPWMGLVFIGLFFTILISLIVLRLFIDWKPLIWFESFFRIGCLIFGGGHVVLSMIMTEFGSFITEEQFMNGFAFISTLPGPMFNIAAYVGAVIGKSVWSALLCWIALFLPAFLLIWGILPFWSKYREKKIVQNILFGVNSIAVGFVYTAVFLLWRGSVPNNNIYSAVTVLLSFTLLCVYDWTAPIVILTGGGTRVALNQIFEVPLNSTSH